MSKWLIYIRGEYLASTIATLEEIKAAFPYATITGICVNVWGRP